MAFSLRLFGGLTLSSEDGPLQGPAAQRNRLALLAILATSPTRTASRDKLMAWLWPERDREHARQLLNQAVHALRRVLGWDVILSVGDDLQFNPAIVHCDVIEFETALAAGRAEDAVALYRGPLLDGFFLDDAQELEQWFNRERDRLAAACGRALEELAAAAEQAGDGAAAVEWWTARAAQDPYDSRVAVRLMRALERVGNRAGALQQGLAHQQRVRDELDIDPDAEVLAAMDRLRRQPALPPSISHESRGSTGPVPPGDLPGVPPAATRPPRRRPVRYAATIVLVTSVLATAYWAADHGARQAGAGTPEVTEQIAQTVVRELERRQGREPARTLREHRTRSIAAYELYLRGSDPALLRSDSAARVGLGYFERAVALDPDYAAAWAGLARLRLRIAEDGEQSAAALARGQADTAARRAVALDDSLAEGHAILGILRSTAWDFPAAERHFLHAIALEPNRARIREWAVNFYLQTGRPEQARAEAEHALALEPLSASASAELARALLAENRCDEALARLKPLLLLEPPLLRVAPIAAQCYGRQGRWADAIAQLRPQAEQGERLSLALLGYLLARAGDRRGADSIQATLRTRWQRGGLGAYYLAFIPTGLGERDEAFVWLNRSLDEGSAGLFPGLRSELGAPVFDDLRPDHRLVQWQQRMGLPAGADAPSPDNSVQHR